MPTSPGPDGASHSSQWRRLYECAVLELSPQRLPRAIALARSAIFDRAEEIMTKPASDEHSALNSALRTLRLLEEIGAREAAGHDAA